MAKEEENIRQLKNKSYEGEVTLHRKDGTSFRKSITRKNKNEVKMLRARLIGLGTLDNDVKTVEVDRWTNEIRYIRTTQDNDIDIILDKEILLEDYLEYYVMTHRKNGLVGKNVEDTTLGIYFDKAKVVKRYIGKKKMVEVTLKDIQNFIEEIQAKYAITTVKQIRDSIKEMFKFAKKDGVVKEDILQGEDINLREHKKAEERYIIEEEDLGTLIKYCLDNKHYVFLMAIYTGCRGSELCGMTWDNLDAENNTITIDKAYMEVPKYYKENGKLKCKKERVFKDLKTKSSYRTIGLDKDFVKLLLEHKEEQKQLAKKNGKEFKETDWIFTTKLYRGFLVGYLSEKFREIVDKLNITNHDKITLHSLRHTYCSLGLSNGIGIKAMQRLLGHSTASTTMSIYAHITERQLISEGSRVGSIISGCLNKK